MYPGGTRKGWFMLRIVRSAMGSLRAPSSARLFLRGLVNLHELVDRLEDRVVLVGRDLEYPALEALIGCRGFLSRLLLRGWLLCLLRPGFLGGRLLRRCFLGGLGRLRGGRRLQ